MTRVLRSASCGTLPAPNERCVDRPSTRSWRKTVFTASPIGMEPHLAAQEIVGIEVTEQKVGIGDRRPRATAAVARRPGFGARAARSHVQLAGIVHAHDAAAARGITIDRRKVHLDEPIRTVGTRMVEVEVAPGVTATVKTMVTEQK